MESSENVDFDPKSIMEWDEGIGTLCGSNLKFKMDSRGELEMVNEEDIEKVKEEWRKNHKSENNDSNQQSLEEILKCEEKLEGSDPIDSKTKSPSTLKPSPVIKTSPPVVERISDPDPDSRKCQNCGTVGSKQDFIRAGKFCSQDCATAQSKNLRLLTIKRPIILGGRDVNTKCESLLKPEVKKPVTEISMSHEKMVLGRGSHKRKQKVLNGSSKLSRTSSPSSTTSSLTQLAQIGGDAIIQSKKVNVNGVPHSPSSPSSVKNSRPSSPSSIGNIQPHTALHQSIFAMRIIQHQQEPPIGWDRHSKNLTSSLDDCKATDIIEWKPDKVADFVNHIPGCNEMGNRFSDQLIDGEAFLLLNQKDIVETLKVKLGPAVKIYNSILVIRDGMEV